MKSRIHPYGILGEEFDALKAGKIFNDHELNFCNKYRTAQINSITSLDNHKYEQLPQRQIIYLQRSITYQSDRKVISKSNIKALAIMFNDGKPRSLGVPTEIRKLTGSNDFLFMENQTLTRRINALKKSETRLKELHAGEIQAKNEKISKFRETVTCRDKEKRKLRARVEKLRYSENCHLQEKRKLHALVDSQSNAIKTLERKLEIQKSKIADLEANLSLDDNRGRAYWLLEQANNLIVDLEMRNEALVKDVEAMTEKYETEKEYTAACRPLMEIGAIIRTRYIYERLLGLGIIGEMPRFILPAANRYVHWADMKADLALFKTGLWTSQNEGAFFKAVYPGHSVESSINLERRSHKSTLTFMNLGIMYQDLHRPGRDFGLKDFPCSEKFQELQKELQDYIAFRSSIRTVGIKTTVHEDRYIELKLSKMMDLMAAFRRAEDTKLALSWLVRDGKETFLTKEHHAVSSKSSNLFSCISC